VNHSSCLYVNYYCCSSLSHMCTCTQCCSPHKLIYHYFIVWLCLETRVQTTDVGCLCPDHVNVIDAGVSGVSDHHLLLWSIEKAAVATARYWSSLPSSSLCQPDSWPADITKWLLCTTTNSTTYSTSSSLFDGSLVGHTAMTDPWFDAECHAAKRLTRRLQWAYSTACRCFNGA